MGEKCGINLKMLAMYLLPLLLLLLEEDWSFLVGVGEKNDLMEFFIKEKV